MSKRTLAVIAVVVVAFLGWIWWSDAESERAITEATEREMREACDNLYLLEGEGFTVAANAHAAFDFAAAANNELIEPDPEVGEFVVVVDRVQALFLSNRPQDWTADEVAELDGLLDQITEDLATLRARYCQ